MKCALAAIISEFKAEGLNICTDVNITGYITIRPKGGLPVKLTPMK
jgi:hypothetical protein